MRIVTLILVLALAAGTLPAATWCDPPPIQNFDHVTDKYPHLKVWAARPFGSGFDAALFLASLLPEQHELGAQAVPLRGSTRYVVVYKLTMAEHQARPIPIHVIAWPTLDSQRAANALDDDVTDGLDGTIVATRDRDAPFIVVTVTSAECDSTDRRRSVRR